DGRSHAVIIVYHDRRIPGLITQTDLLAPAARMHMADTTPRCSGVEPASVGQAGTIGREEIEVIAPAVWKRSETTRWTHGAVSSGRYVDAAFPSPAD
ncbi:MAG: hypothetical protein E5W01_05610, partial [Mesorhizobium sp.]